MFAPGYCDCFYDNLRLEYLGNGDVRNPDGVETRLVDYGGVSGVQYWGDVVNALKAEGYTVGTDLFAAPYDFRRGPKQFMEFDYPRLKSLIENASAANGGAPVVLCSISMGGSFGHLFLTRFVDAAWKLRYIDSWISLSGTFNGAPQMVEQLTSGTLYADERAAAFWLDKNDIREFCLLYTSPSPRD